jgi:hypothetical protein
MKAVVGTVACTRFRENWRRDGGWTVAAEVLEKRY